MSNTSSHLSLHVIICLCRLSFIFFLLATMLVFCLPAVLSVSCCNSTILTLSNLFKNNNNKAYLESAQLLVRGSGSTYLGSKVRGYCWEERGQKKNDLPLKSSLPLYHHLVHWGPGLNMGFGRDKPYSNHSWHCLFNLLFATNRFTSMCTSSCLWKDYQEEYLCPGRAWWCQVRCWSLGTHICCI